MAQASRRGEGEGLLLPPPNSPHRISAAYDSLAANMHLEIPHHSYNSTSPFGHHSPHRRRRRHHNLCINPQLPRSMCLSAIDGMLTGAGVLAAYVGLGLPARIIESSSHNTNTVSGVDWLPVALTLAATLADGVCMAIGHVWSTSEGSEAAYREREEELQKFEDSRSDAKARLVDALLVRGMLKIDAMSLADTLEGYPDLFVETLQGGGGPSAGPFSPTGAQHLGEHGGHGWDAPPQFYGCDDDLHHLDAATESATEGVVMMGSFAAFSLIPSVVFAFLPRLVPRLASAEDGLLLSLAVCLSALVMFHLGMWKSRYFASNPFLFGLKTVAVLAICVITAFSVGHVFRGRI